MTLAVLPGWNTFCTGMSVVAATLAGSDGLNVGYCASARICPVRGSIATTEQFVACAFLTSAAHACSAYHWMSAWTVSCRLPAGTGARSVCSVPGIGSGGHLCLLAAVPPAQQGVVFLLEPCLTAQVARRVGVGEADEVRGEVAVRVDAGVGRLLGDARQIE